MNILAIDYGKKYVGVALSQNGREPQALATIEYRDEFELKKALTEFVRQYEPRVVAIGATTHTGPETNRFISYLDGLSYVERVEFINEAHTTTQAQKELAEEQTPAARRQKANHARAAALILRDYLAGV